MKFKKPTTTIEWHEVLALAHACLYLDSARQYGLIVGGPAVNAARCDALIRRGEALGHRVTQSDVDAALSDLLWEITTQQGD